MRDLFFLLLKERNSNTLRLRKPKAMAVHLIHAQVLKVPLSWHFPCCGAKETHSFSLFVCCSEEREVFIHVLEVNEGALRLYQAIGFQVLVRGLLAHPYSMQFGRSPFSRMLYQ